MEILYLLIPLSVVLVFLIGAILWWSIRSGQFDDLEGPAYRIVMDDDRPPDVVGVDKEDQSGDKEERTKSPPDKGLAGD